MNKTEYSNHLDRLDFLDCVRGMAMLFVVYYHILFYDCMCYSVVNEIVIRWRMPLFFFVSGYFAVLMSYDKNLFSKRLENRFVRQLYPTLLVCLCFNIYLWIREDNSLMETVLHGIYDPTKRGYWFTMALVEAYVLYQGVTIALFKWNVSLSKQRYVYLGISLFFGLTYLYIFRDSSFNGVALQIYNVLCIPKLVSFIPFFFLGVTCRLFGTSFLSIIKLRYSLVVTLFVYVVAYLMSSMGYYSYDDSVVYYLSRIVGIFLILSWFANFENIFCSKTKLGRFLIRIGKNTLPIYLFHFFLIVSIPSLFDSYAAVKSSLCIHWYVELPIVLVVSVLLTEICLLLNKMIKYVPIMYDAIFNPLKLYQSIKR